MVGGSGSHFNRAGSFAVLSPAKYVQAIASVNVGIAAAVSLAASQGASLATLVTIAATASTASSGFVTPTSSNTGSRIAAGSLTTISGDYTLADGEVLSGKNITGILYTGNVKNGAHVSDCIINAVGANQLSGGNYGGGTPNGASTPCLIEYCNIGVVTSNGGAYYTFDHCRVGNVTNSFFQIFGVNTSPYIFADHWKITNCLMDRLVNTALTTYHLEAIHTFGWRYSLLQNNYFDYGTSNDTNTTNQITAVWNLGPTVDGSGNAGHDNVYDSNELHGGGTSGGSKTFQIYCGGLNETYTNNRMFGYGSTLQYPSGGAGTHTILAQSGNTSDGVPFTFAAA
jgi:hypothetical protein